MKNADFNSIDDLLASELFRKWIIDKDEEAAVFWSQWIEQNPARLEWVATAKAIIETLTKNSDRLANHEVNAEAELIQQKILSLNPELYADEEPGYLETYYDGNERGSKGIFFLRRTRRYIAGLAAALLMIAGGYWYFSGKPRCRQMPIQHLCRKQSTKALNTITIQMGSNTLCYPTAAK
jgi:transmembrane sensor